LNSREIQPSILLECNRLTIVLIVFSRRLLCAGLSALVGIEAAVNVEALAERARWGAKWRAYWWLVRHTRDFVKRHVAAATSEQALTGNVLQSACRSDPTNGEWICHNLANRAVRLYSRADGRAFRVG
jgi:hypothetical protein